MNLKDIDLNLLVIFQQLLQERRVSAVAVNLGLTQPTVSNALNRLRQQLGDDLFLRTSKGMEPTAYAMQLAEPIGYALAAIQETLNQNTRFDATTSQRKFIVGMSDIGEIYFFASANEDSCASGTRYFSCNYKNNRCQLGRRYGSG